MYNYARGHFEDTQASAQPFFSLTQGKCEYILVCLNSNEAGKIF